jgi:hypothetical protein
LPVALAGALAACGLGTLSPDELRREYPYAAIAVLNAGTFASARAALEHQIGGGDELRVVRVSVHDDYLYFEKVQDPRNPAHYDTYEWHDGELAKPSPQPSGSRSDYEEQSFPLSDAPRELLSYATRAYADTRASVEDGELKSIDVSRAPDHHLRVYVRVAGPRDSATREYAVSAAGAPSAP